MNLIVACQVAAIKAVLIKAAMINVVSIDAVSMKLKFSMEAVEIRQTQ